MEDWRYNVIDLLKRNDDCYFSVEWLANNFDTTIEVMSDFIEHLEELEMIHYINIYINLKKVHLYQTN
jgi:hypothetical protein